MEIVWSRAADDDLGQIYGYYETRSRRAARRLLRHLFAAIDLLVEMPRMGAVSLYQTDREYRELVVGRLWDTRQDPTRFFLPRG